MSSFRLGAIFAAWIAACLLAASSVGATFGFFAAIPIVMIVGAAVFALRQAAGFLSLAPDTETLVLTVFWTASVIAATVVVVLASKFVTAVQCGDSEEARRVAGVAVHAAGASASFVLAVRTFVTTTTWS